MNYLFSLFITLSLFLATHAYALPETSLRNKIGQMLLIGFDEKQIDAHSKIVSIIEKNNIGGVILFDYNNQTKTFNKNIESPFQVKKLTHDLRYWTQKANLKHHRPNLPLLISVDYEGGRVTRLSQQHGFPTTLSAKIVGQKGLKAAKTNAQLMSYILKNMGFNLDFAPLVDLNSNPNNPIIAKKDRSFSPDPYIVIHNAEIYSRQFLHQKVQCVYKHFPGHGSANADSHLGFVDVTDTWQPNELKPYEDLLNKEFSCGVVMTAHIVNRHLDKSGLPATLSHKILTNILRNQLHFKGVIITDDMQMKAISKNFRLEEALVLAINAGADMFIFGNNLPGKVYEPEYIINLIEANVRSGKISQKRIEDAYQHIVNLKNSLK